MITGHFSPREVYIAQDKPDAAFRWVQVIREKCELLAEQPEMGEERKGFGVLGCRSFAVGTYVVFYRAIEGGIQVARVVHGSRDLDNL
ncbi:MAG: type II toxin-antitoxin system RelE/ParE family toxin [Planctomycetaceae bacterium]|nr:type II toxin-antitoxin system RelE/ParE family toxin [Planctomycetaceae bacterium]